LVPRPLIPSLAAVSPPKMVTEWSPDTPMVTTSGQGRDGRTPLTCGYARSRQSRAPSQGGDTGSNPVGAALLRSPSATSAVTGWSRPGPAWSRTRPGSSPASSVAISGREPMSP
jgi:hypothetical protein